MDNWYRIQEKTLVVDIKAVPGASKTEIAGIAENRLRIRIAAAPEDGKANAELIAFLAKKTGMAKRDIRLVLGEKNRLKTVELPQEALQPLLALIDS
ncbi:DUF167 domain-containing protein [Gracilinema caldarium]|uniref:DUF167 domain-containing protein n=1 Tax=Gracilinema caldarium TaxID=215591 RepID=UPI0026F344BC|nr:DUF167 domain-containing protein [Gracilinema caldarium]